MRSPPRRSAFLVAALALSSAPGAGRADGALAPLLDRVVAAYGGRAALEKVRAVKEEGTVTSMMHPAPGRIVRVFQRPGSLRVEIAYPEGSPEVRVVHGGHGHRDGQEVTGPAHAAMVLQAARLALPLALVQKGARVADRGTIERDGQTRRAVALALPGALELVAEIDPASGRIVRSSGAMPGPGGKMEFATAYSDFRPVAGVLFAHHEESWAGGQHTGATELQRVEILPAAPPGTFDEQL
jgi:hypothetical protein